MGILKYAQKLSAGYRGLLIMKDWRKTVSLYKRMVDVEDNEVSDALRTPPLRIEDINETSKPMIALTFDDGPSDNDVSDRILDLLLEYNVHATFFMIGKKAKSHSENVIRKLKLNHEIGSHTWDHMHGGDEVTQKDIMKGARAIEEITGTSPSCFRSPYGTTKPHIRDICEKMGFPLYYWTIDTRDWETKNAQMIYEMVMKNVKDGDIILMHENYESTAQAVEKMLPELIEQGYQIVTCRELIYRKTGKEPVPGCQYCSSYIINNDTD